MAGVGCPSFLLITIVLFSIQFNVCQGWTGQIVLDVPRKLERSAIQLSPHAEDCHIYYYNTFPMTCGPLLAFNKNTLRCDSLQNVATVDPICGERFVKENGGDFGEVGGQGGRVISFVEDVGQSGEGGFFRRLGQQGSILKKTHGIRRDRLRSSFPPGEPHRGRGFLTLKGQENNVKGAQSAGRLSSGIDQSSQFPKKRGKGHSQIKQSKKLSKRRKQGITAMENNGNKGLGFLESKQSVGTKESGLFLVKNTTTYDESNNIHNIHIRTNGERGQWNVSQKKGGWSSGGSKGDQRNKNPLKDERRASVISIGNQWKEGPLKNIGWGNEDSDGGSYVSQGRDVNIKAGEQHLDRGMGFKSKKGSTRSDILRQTGGSGRRELGVTRKQTDTRKKISISGLNKQKGNQKRYSQNMSKGGRGENREGGFIEWNGIRLKGLKKIQLGQRKELTEDNILVEKRIAGTRGWKIFHQLWNNNKVNKY